MINLPDKLKNIPKVEHAIYADDITIWCKSGSNGQVEERLQAAADITAEYARSRGLQCTPEKSELLVLRNPREGLITHINVKMDGQEVPKPQEARILGQLIPQGRNNKSRLDKLTKATVQINGMLRRIRNQQHGLKEREAMQLVHAFVVSRVMYGPPHLNLTKKEVEKLDVLLRKAYKNALGLQEYAATKRLLQLGVHNTFEELANAQIGAQIRRLGGTDSGRWVLYKLELAKPNAAFLQQQIKLDDYIRAGVRTSRISRNMNPSRDAERRMARSEALARTWDSRPGTLYVDAAGPVSGVATAAVATSDGRKIVTKASFRVSCATEAEEVAIALAITCNPKATIISDSQGAVRNFTAGSVGEVAAGLLRRHPPQRELKTVLDMGVTPDRIVYANTVKSTSHLKYASEHGVTLMTFDSAEELVKMDDKNARLLLRIAASEFGSQYTMNEKFGAYSHEIENILKVALELGRNVVGVAFHVGCAYTHPDIFVHTIDHAKRVFDLGTEMGFRMNVLDIGGGFPGGLRKQDTMAEASFH
ncbi:hypothetical protein ISCGN_015426 [Ixodes scapularis]